MAQLGIAPNLTIYTSLIDACVQAGDEQYMQVGAGCGAVQFRGARGALGAGHCRTTGLGSAAPPPAGIMWGPNLSIKPCTRTVGSSDRPLSARPCHLQLAFELLDQMRGEGLAPSAVTYGCLLAACERTGDVSRAFQLYQQACAEVGAAVLRGCMRGLPPCPAAGACQRLGFV